MKFEDYRISPEIKNNLELLGFKKPTDIQFKAIPAILKREDVLAIAQTGTGKTAAFAIPVINILHEQKTSKRAENIKCLVMAPTRELAIQISEVFEKLSKHTKVKTFCVHGGVEQDSQIEKLQRGIDILIATPGRMFDLISQGHINLNSVDILILDEADHMLDLGFIKDIQDVIRFIPRRHQTLFFSATINEVIKKLAYSIVEKPIRIQISPKDPVAKNITHSVINVEMDHKRHFLERIIKEHPESKILVFVRTKVRAERVLKAMERVDIKCETIHGGKEQNQRNYTMSNFKTGTLNVLVATDVSARGIDVPKVEYVINYDLPDVPENYVHRVGRTGRGKEKGVAISFCSEEEKPVLEKIEEFLTKKVNVIEMPKDEYKEIVDFREEKVDDWQSIMKENEDYLATPKKKKKRKVNKK